MARLSSYEGGVDAFIGRFGPRRSASIEGYIGIL